MIERRGRIQNVYNAPFWEVFYVNIWPCVRVNLVSESNFVRDCISFAELSYMSVWLKTFVCDCTVGEVIVGIVIVIHTYYVNNLICEYFYVVSIVKFREDGNPRSHWSFVILHATVYCSYLLTRFSKILKKKTI